MNYCSWGDYHTELGFTDPACADHYDLFVECAENSLSTSTLTALQNGVAWGREGKGVVCVPQPPDRASAKCAGGGGGAPSDSFVMLCSRENELGAAAHQPNILFCAHERAKTSWGRRRTNHNYPLVCPRALEIEGGGG